VLLTSVEKILLCIRICMLSDRLGAHNLFYVMLPVVTQCFTVVNFAQLCLQMYRCVPYIGRKETCEKDNGMTT